MDYNTRGGEAIGLVKRLWGMLGCGKEEEVLKIVHSCIDMAMAYVLHRVFLNIMHVIFLVFCISIPRSALPCVDKST